MIERGLQQLTPDLPILSEESAQVPWEVRQHWGAYWLVDPLDGTREFVKRNDEFSVNIALIYQGAPAFGVVLAPVSGIAWHAMRGSWPTAAWACTTPCCAHAHRPRRR